MVHVSRTDRAMLENSFCLLNVPGGGPWQNLSKKNGA